MQTISFGNSYYDGKYTSQRRTYSKPENRYSQSSNQTVRRNNNTDSYSTRYHQKQSIPTWKKIGLIASGVAVGAGGAVVANNISDNIKAKPTYTYYEVQPYDDIEEVAALYNSDSRAIIDLNQLESEAPMVNGDKIKIPQLFDNVQSSIDKLRAELYNKHISSEEREVIATKIRNLQQRQSAQQAAALCYSDGHFVYLRMLDSYSAEDVKGLFGIKDGALKDYNNLEFEWGYNPDLESHNGYMDYTNSWLDANTTYKVPIGKIASNFED